jgi:hypothetical protein
VDNTGKVTAISVGVTTIHAAPWNARGFGGICNVTVKPILTYPDTLIDHEDTCEKILFLKGLIVENERAYLKGKISLDTKELIERQLEHECNISRADYIVVGKNPTSDFAYAVLGGDPNAIVPFSFSQNLMLYSTGLAVIVVQRALEAMGYLDMKDSQGYGVFDHNTYNAACSVPLLMSYDEDTEQYYFNNESFNVLFHYSTAEQRTYAVLSLLNELRIMHNEVAQWCAAKVGGTYRMSDNKIKFGNVGATYYGYADVLQKNEGIGTYLWEVKPNKTIYTAENGIGYLQVERYLNAGKLYDQDFPKPLKIGYNLGKFSIPSPFGNYIKVQSYYYPGSADHSLNALVLYEPSQDYNEEFELETTPIFLPKASDEYLYSGRYDYNIVTGGCLAIIGIAVVAGIVCWIAAPVLAGAGSVSVSALTALSTYIPMAQAATA